MKRSDSQDEKRFLLLNTGDSEATAEAWIEAS
jgi:hypothetical protein